MYCLCGVSGGVEVEGRKGAVSFVEAMQDTESDCVRGYFVSYLFYTLGSLVGSKGMGLAWMVHWSWNYRNQGMVVGRHGQQ